VTVVRSSAGNANQAQPQKLVADQWGNVYELKSDEFIQYGTIFKCIKATRPHRATGSSSSHNLQSSSMTLPAQPLQQQNVVPKQSSAEEDTALAGRKSSAGSEGEQKPAMRDATQATSVP
jgi:hypothetical protein